MAHSRPPPSSGGGILPSRTASLSQANIPGLCKQGAEASPPEPVINASRKQKEAKVKGRLSSARPSRKESASQPGCRRPQPQPCLGGTDMGSAIPRWNWSHSARSRRPLKHHPFLMPTHNLIAAPLQPLSCLPQSLWPASSFPGKGHAIPSQAGPSPSPPENQGGLALLRTGDRRKAGSSSPPPQWRP